MKLPDCVAALPFGSDQIVAAAPAAVSRGVIGDSSIPSGEGLFAARVEFGSTGVVMANIANSLPGGIGQLAALPATPVVANRNAWIANMQDARVNDANSAVLDNSAEAVRRSEPCS